MMFSSQAIRLAIGVLFVFAVVLGLCANAFAGDPLAKPKDATAQKHLAAGNKLYRVREFEKAVEEYKAGALAEDVPVFHYNLGQCYRQLGRYDDAIWHYERFLERGKPEGQMKGAVEAFVSQMKSELQKKAMTQPPTEAAPEPKPIPEPAQPKVTVVRVPGEPWYRDTIGWSLAGAGFVGIGVAAWLFASANSTEDDANAQANQSERERLRDRASSRRVVGSVVGIGSAALLVTGIVKLALRPGDREERVTTTSIDFSVSRDGIFVVGRF